MNKLELLVQTMSSPEVSVIIPTYNRPNLLPRAIGSVLNQTYTNFECIVVDDASPVDSSSVVAEFDDDRLVYFEHEINQGASAARNTGIAHAKGEYIAFLDDDDEWLSTKLEKQIDLFNNLSDDIGLIYTWMNYRKQGGDLVKEYKPTYQGYVFPHVLDGQRIGGCPTLLVRKEVVDEVDGFDESLPRGNDGDFIRRVCINYKVAHIPEALVNVYVDHGHDRITDEDEEGIRNAIKGQEIKLKKFGPELEKYPKRAGRIHAQIAFRYSQLGEWQSCKSHYRKAISTAPMSFEVYKSIGRSLGIWLVR